MVNLLTRKLYTEGTLDTAIAELQSLAETPDSIDETLKKVGINEKILVRTAKKGMTENVDGEVELRHAWKPKMMDGTPEEKKEIYNGLHNILKRMDQFSEPYISSMRLISDVLLKQLSKTIVADKEKINESIDESLNYKGIHYNFNEQTVIATPKGQITTARKTSASVKDAYSQITKGFMRLKDFLNLMEDVTDPEVYENVKNTNDFPEARIGRCFEVSDEIDKTMKQILEGYKFLSKKTNLPESDRRRIDKSLKFLKGLDRGILTRATQEYAALQFNEKPWNKIYKASIASLVASIAGAAYSLKPFLDDENILSKYTNDTLLGLAGAIWTIASGVAVYASTDAGPKTAKSLRNLDEKFIEYKWI